MVAALFYNYLSVYREKRLHVTFTQDHSCWVTLPAQMSSCLIGSAVSLPLTLNMYPIISRAGLSVPDTTSCLVVAWAGSVHAKQDCIGIPSCLATCFGLMDGAAVEVEQRAPSPPVATSISIEPTNADEWEVAELSAEFIEDHLLNQCGVVTLGQSLPVWVHNHLVTFTVTHIQPPSAHTVKLAAGMEVLVVPNVRQSVEETRQSTILRFQPELLAVDGGKAGGNGTDSRSGSYDMMRVFIHPETLKRSPMKEGDIVEIKAKSMGKLIGCVRAHKGAQLGHFVPDKQTPLESWSHFTLQTVTMDKRASVTQDSFTNKDSKFKALQSGARVRERVSLPDVSWLGDSLEQAMKWLLPVLASGPRSMMYSWNAPHPGGVLISGPAGSGKAALVEALAATLHHRVDCLTHTVRIDCRSVVGGEGPQQIKLQVIPYLREAVNKLPCLVVFENLDVLCPSESETPENGAMMQKTEPAVVYWLCDIIHHLTDPSPRWGRDPTILNGVPVWPPVAIMATVRDPAALAPQLREPLRFSHQVTLPPPSAASRAAMLMAALPAKGATADPTVIRSLAEKAEGFDAADLGVLLDRAMHVAVRRYLLESRGSPGGPRQLMSADKKKKEAPLLLKSEDLNCALEGLTPSAFWGAGTHGKVQHGVSGWENVGGMTEARSALVEALELPIKYAALLSRAPLRLRTGVLLYGPPGCGKTHIVAAAVAAANVRCITVAGPELLNKYIGASEAAVRDVFIRASAAAPCVLFFDEFDAIAPRRGHDNTGVTDRVVNQLLTELDGVSGLKGVCVVGATSRPDLIDPALLRPGRLDRLIHCGMPKSSMDRRDILSALSRGLSLAADANLDSVATSADNFTGADLGALLAEAQLKAVHEALDHNIEAHVPPSVGDRHLQAAFSSAKPSLSDLERGRLERIYAEFQGGKRGDVSAVQGSHGKMVSWA